MATSENGKAEVERDEIDTGIYTTPVYPSLEAWYRDPDNAIEVILDKPLDGVSPHDTANVFPKAVTENNWCYLTEA